MTAEQLGSLGLAAGVSVASGLRVYATIAVLGLLDRADVLQLPAGLEPLKPIVALRLAWLTFVEVITVSMEPNRGTKIAPTVRSSLSVTAHPRPPSTTLSHPLQPFSFELAPGSAVSTT